MMIFRTQDFLNVLPFTSNDATRYYLQGVCLQLNDDKSLQLTATDGTVLGTQRSTDFFYNNGIFDDTLIVNPSKDFIALMKKHAKKEGSYCILEKDHNGNALSLVNAINTPLHEVLQDYRDYGVKSKSWVSAENDILIDGHFPDWRNVLPEPKKNKNPEFVDIDLKRLSRFGHLTNDKVCGLRLVPMDKGCPIPVYTNIPDFYGVIMPMIFGSSMTSI